MTAMITRGFRFVWVLCVLPVTLLQAFRGLPVDSSGQVAVTPGQDIAAIVNRSPSNSTFILSPGVYRQVSILPKDGDRFYGRKQTILNGSKLLHLQQDGNLWSTTETIAKSDPKYCRPDQPRCYLLSDLFVDDVLQKPVADLQDLQQGSWYYDLETAKIFLGINPTEHKVELSITPAAFSGRATGVEIRGIIVEKYASPPQRGAIGSGGISALPANWVLTNVEARWNHGGGVHVGANSRIESSDIHDNGQIGVGGSGDDIVVANNRIAYNNYAGYRVDWEAGALKFARTNRLVIRSNQIVSNRGNGLWTDIDNVHVLIENNTVLDNTNEGIRHEIGYDAIIRNNLLRGNEAGIVIALSANVDVYGNTIEVPTDGDFAFRLDAGHRSNADNSEYHLQNVRVHDNVISYLGTKGHSGLIGDSSTASGIVFDANEYHITNGDARNRWRWNNRSIDLMDVHQLGLEGRGKILGAAQNLPDPTHTKSSPDRTP